MNTTMSTLTVSGQRFGVLLREFRLAAGLSQEALAERACISVDGISALERGTNRAPQRETLALLVRALGLTPEEQHTLEAAAVRPSKPRRTAERVAKRHNLPRTMTRLYGRQREIDAVISQLDVSPLVTLTGAGGVGKTRLALEVGDRLASRFDDGVWFVDLAAIADGKLVPSAAALPFGVIEPPDRPLTETLTHALSRKNLLLIVDNCEHVVDAASALVQALIQDCPGVRVLATSRQSLNLAGEQIYRVASLQPEPAMELFVDHAKRTAESFDVGDENRKTIERIVRRLDGIALALELAAARLRLLSPGQLEERLTERFRVLTGGSHMKLPRQQTMRATIDWSYGLLEADERAILRRIAVFPGPFSLDAAAAVCGDERIDEWRVLELLGSLVDKSLLLIEPAGSSHRYRMLDSIRAYAREKAADERETTQTNRRHAEFFARVADRAAADFPQAGSTAGWADALEPDLENFRTALDWSLGDYNDPELGVQLLTRLQEFWLLQGLAQEVLRYAPKAQSVVDRLPQQLAAALWLSLARMQHQINNPHTLLDAASRACDLFESAGDARGLATALRERGIAQMHTGAFPESERDLQRSLDMFREFGDVRMVARTLGSLGALRQLKGEFEDARPMMLEVLQLSKELEDDRTAIVMSINIAEMDFALGDAASAADRARDNLANDPMLRKSVDLRATQEANLAAYLYALGSHEEARAMALLALRDADYYYAAVPIQHIAAILAPSDPQRAARLLGYADKVLALSGFSVERTEQYTRECLVAALDETLGKDEIARLRSEGSAMPEEQALRLARRRMKEVRS